MWGAGPLYQCLAHRPQVAPTHTNTRRRIHGLKLKEVRVMGYMGGSEKMMHMKMLQPTEIIPQGRLHLKHRMALISDPWLVLFLKRSKQKWKARPLSAFWNPYPLEIRSIGALRHLVGSECLQEFSPTTPLSGPSKYYTMTFQRTFPIRQGSHVALESSGLHWNISPC